VESPVGLPGRAILNDFVKKLKQGCQPAPEKCRGCLKVCSNKYCIMDALENSRTGNVDNGLVFCGQNVYQIKDILPVSEIFRQIIADVESVK